VRLVVCAGYDRILSDEFLDAYPDAILNVHPSLLPAFAGGMDAVERALARGVRVTGCTVQLLERGEADGGPIVLQAAVPVEIDDDAVTLRRRIHESEWELLPRAVALWCTGRMAKSHRNAASRKQPAVLAARIGLKRIGLTRLMPSATVASAGRSKSGGAEANGGIESVRFWKKPMVTSAVRKMAPASTMATSPSGHRRGARHLQLRMTSSTATGPRNAAAR